MSTTNDPNLDTTSSSVFVHTPTSFEYAVTHVFLPVKLPDHNDYTPEKDLSLARAVCAAAHAYSAYIERFSEPRWDRITKMLDNLQASAQFEHLDRDNVISQLREMQAGDNLVFFVRSQNTAVVLTKQQNNTLFESFDVCPRSDALEEAEGSLRCSYPWSAVETSNEVFDTGDLQIDLADLLSRSDAAPLDLPSPPATRSQYVPAHLTDILGSVGRTADVPRTTKCVRDNVVQLQLDDAAPKSFWHRSALWLLIRVAIQTSLDRSPFGRVSYKQFMLFFICTLARDTNTTNLSSDLLHLMSSKILRRLSKFRTSTPDWLSEMALKTCACLREILDHRWMQLRTNPSPFRNPSQEELIRDTHPSLLGSHEYICNALANHRNDILSTPFHPSHRRRGTIDDFLSSDGSFFEEAHFADPHATLLDVEQSIEQGIDDWFTSVTNVDEACAQLEILMDKYMMKATILDQLAPDPENRSIMFLTAIELFVALDKLVLKEIPLLADYSPEIRVALLEKLLLRKTTSLHRLSRAYQYLAGRQSRSRLGWSVLSNEFAEDSFAVRYFDRSPHLQHLKVRIERDAIVAGRTALARDGYKENQEQLSRKHQAESAEACHSPLPASPSYAKVVIFELQCPPCFRIWRSAAARILYYLCYPIHDPTKFNAEKEDNLLVHVPALRPYFAQRKGPPLSFQMHFVYYYQGFSQSRNSPILRYAIQHFTFKEFGNPPTRRLSIWEANVHHTDWQFSLNFTYSVSSFFLWGYVYSTSHTSNDVLSAQANCPVDFSLDELIAFGQLRSGSSLQWLNILRGICSRTLNFHRREVHVLLAQAAFQVGPLDLDTGIWVWHNELQDPSFCDALLDELDNLVKNVGAALIDGLMMNTVSLLLARVLASSPGEHTSERAIALLRSVRRKTFNWVQELSYTLTKAPMNEERRDYLLDMAATCQSTFDVSPATFRRLLHSGEDVDAMLSCAALIHTLHPRVMYKGFSQFHLTRNRRLALALEGTLRDVIVADVSDYGIDLAVGKIFPSYKPSAHRWQQLQDPNASWLTCKNTATGDEPWQTVHLNLLDGALRMGGKSGGLLDVVENSPECQLIFRDQGFFVIPSNLPGMDFTTFAMTFKRKVHFSLRSDSLMIRAQYNQSNDILELIPSSKLEEDLPSMLVDGYVHWLNLSTKVVEICPLECLWEQSSENWRINCASKQYRIYKGRETLVDIRSPTWAMVWECFKCLNGTDEGSKDQSGGLLVTTSPIETLQPIPVLRLSVTLPRYGLSFFVNEQGELESNDFKGMVYDENQCVDALFGLETLLVLRQKTHLPEELVARKVLIPTGFLRHHWNHPHWAHTKPVQPIQFGEPLYYTYNVDTELGCLAGDGSLASTRYLAYLHAMTTFHRPDPLTGKTGAQAALCLLQSAGCRSIMELKALDADKYWTSTEYPQINIAHKEIQHRYYWSCVSFDFHHFNRREVGAARRAAYLFPWYALGPTLLEDCNYDDSSHLVTWHTTAEPGLPTPPPSVSPLLLSNQPKPWQTSLEQLLSNRPTPELPARSTLPRRSYETFSDDIFGLDLSPLASKSGPSFQQEYITRLSASTQHVRKESRTIYRLVGEHHIKTLEEYYAQCRKNYLAALCILKRSLGPTVDPLDQALDQFGQWPPITADVLLRYLATTSPFNVPREWKKCLVLLALLLLDLQRARRLLRFVLDGLEEEFSKELANEGCDGWDPEDYPDWLLIQIQGNFLIRRTQAETAMEMMSPKAGGNTVMQVNMGEGKSSVIIPITTAALANGKQLVRVVVPKALTVQMYALLVHRLGGLANRPIYHLPFSRTPRYGLQVDVLWRLMSQCMAEHGILLVQPEDIASLKLMSVEEQLHGGNFAANPLRKPQRLIYKHITTALSLKSLPKHSIVGNILQFLSKSPRPSKTKLVWANYQDEYDEDTHSASDSSSKWLNVQKWIHSHARDVLDESDEILHPRFQLIYTIGVQQHLDGYPGRWTITQQILRLVKECAYTLSRDHGNSIEYTRDPPGSFPHIRIVGGPNAGRQLISLIVEGVMAGQLPSFDFQHVWPQASRDAIRSFICDEDLLPGTAKIVEEYAERDSQSYLWNGLLILRGLLASNILLFALTERRWRVDYGLVSHSSFVFGSMLAVPYRAKDVPAPKTQFGHPDIAIILTCLSYYYTGLSEWQLREAFEILVDQEDPSTEYAHWVKERGFKSLPDSLRKLGDINLRSSEQWDDVIFPLFSRNQVTVDFYLSRVVFPKKAREFPWKLSASGWDLAEKRENVITGFSGTNDTRWLLPLSIAQRDLDHQQGANARVLAHLLQPENNSYIVTHENGERWTTPRLLQMIAIQQPSIRILLDVGAQILDFSNDQVAKAWLDIARDAVGAIYFDGKDELVVLTRRGTTQPMRSSPLSRQLDYCVVYLDHAHTRGTDLNLPIGSRAAVTLGPKVTKDHLVQGCMRMRKLGHGHSVMFFAPLDVDLSIRAAGGTKDPNSRVTSIDILRWAIHETWNDIQRWAPYWAQQGMSHKSRSDAWARFCNNELGPDQLSDAWLQPEVKSLADLYAPREDRNSLGSLSVLDPGIRQRCKDLGILSISNAQMEEEQEREVNREQHRERQVELPPRAEPAEHYLHPDVIQFVKTGEIPPLHANGAFHPVFTTLEKSSAATRDADVWSPFILATTDFCKTITPESTQGTMDQYLRPVQWILSRRALEDRDPVLVLLSPFEANSLMPIIRTSECVHLHLYAPRTSQRMKPSDDLKLYSIPPLPSDWTPPWALIDQLNVFAGQLYLRDYQSYLRLCRFLDVPTKDSPNDSAVRWNLFNIPGSLEENEVRFSGSPLPTVMALLAVRNRGLPFAETHMGKILQGQQLTEEDFQGTMSVTYDGQTPYEPTQENIPPSPSDTE